MKDLIFSISLRNHTFDIRTTPQSTLCCYHNKGKYTTSLTFASKTYASVEYQNVKFSGTVTKRNSWSVKLDYRTILHKHSNCYHFLSNEPVQSKEENDAIRNSAPEYPDKILMLYTQLIEFLPEYYLCIEDKETFKRQLCEYLSEEYQDYGIEDLDQIVEYENWDNVKFDEDPIIEKTSKKNILIKDCQDCFICFRQSEIDIKNIKSIITMENVIRETPSLCQVPHKLLQKEFDGYLAENYADLIEPNIWYYQEEVLQNIANEIYTSCQYALFINTLDEKIDEILSSMVVGDIDKNEISSYFKLIYTRDSLPSNEDFELCVRELVNKHVAFNQIYEKFVALFNTDYIQIEWNDEKLGLFQKYDEEGWVDSQNLAEYEAYKYIIPLYKQHFLCKNSTRYRPVIEQLPVFFSYASNVLDILFKHKILIHNDNVVVYNHDGNVELACKEIMALPE